MHKGAKIETFEDILQALRERPEWLEELRRLILAEELLVLPQKFEAFRIGFERFKKEEFLPLREQVDRIEKDVAVLKQDVAILKQDVAVLKKDVALLKEEVAILKIDVADLKGDNFERKVRERAPSYFGKLMRRCKVISHEELANILDDAVDNGVISESERDNAINIDVVVTGLLRQEREKKVVAATEVSIKADRIDVERASERADIIGRAMNLPAIPIVIGKEYTKGAEARAKELNVILC